MKERMMEMAYEEWTWDELPMDLRELVECAKRASGRAYAPYSRFQVGAAVLLADGTVVEGNNQENIAYPSGLCAERTALFSANANHPDQPVTMLAIAAQTGGAFLPNPITPCGSCRQVMLETERRFGVKMDIILYGTEKIFRIRGASSLLPLQFEM